MTTREKAQHIIDSRAKATAAPLKAVGMGSEGYNLYARPEGVSLRDVYDAIGFRGCVGEIRAGKDWAQLRGNAEYIEVAWNGAPDIARKLIEALDVLERIEWAGSDEFEAPWRECPICGAPKRKRQHKPGCEIGALLHGEKGDADND